MIKFLENHSEKEKELNLDLNHVIVNKKEWEAIRSAHTFGKIKIIDGNVFPVPSFRYELGQRIVLTQPKVVKDVNPFIIVGRIQWKGYENDYVVKRGKETKQVSESSLIPVP